MRVQAQLQDFRKHPNLLLDGGAQEITEPEIKLCALTIVHAFLNPCESSDLIITTQVIKTSIVNVEWDFDRYSDSAKPSCTRTKEADSSFKVSADTCHVPLSLGEITEPATLVDVHGRILVWYLPGILTDRRVVSLFQLPFGSISHLLYSRSA